MSRLPLTEATQGPEPTTTTTSGNDKQVAKTKPKQAGVGNADAKLRFILKRAWKTMSTARYIRRRQMKNATANIARTTRIINLVLTYAKQSGRFMQVRYCLVEKKQYNFSHEWQSPRIMFKSQCSLR
jgi:hypothetical protein